MSSSTGKNEEQEQNKHPGISLDVEVEDEEEVFIQVKITRPKSKSIDSKLPKKLSQVVKTITKKPSSRYQITISTAPKKTTIGSTPKSSSQSSTAIDDQQKGGHGGRVGSKSSSTSIVEQNGGVRTITPISTGDLDADVVDLEQQIQKEQEIQGFERDEEEEEMFQKLKNLSTQPMEAKSEPMQVPTAVSNPNPPISASQLPVRTQSLVRASPAGREMSMEERQELGIGFQSLPPEKIGHMVDILTKRNRNLRDKDEIEVDLENLDTETLWELDRFVTNYKKIERQALMSHRVSESDVVPAAASNPKPKAKDPNKRAMSMEEKHKLVTGLNSLPQEKLVHVVLLLTKRNGNLLQFGDDMDIDLETVWELDQDDDIEIDLDALDLETVRELYRLVTKYSRIS
ncbi:hypothetical protein Q3G72_032994 [Acer saccharum]|nr:hypothetical protein Q3G72_032994 [Acer saccharum]